MASSSIRNFGTKFSIFPEKLHWQYLLKKPGEAETHCLHLSWYNTIPPHPKEQHPLLTGIKVRVFFGKKHRKKHLCCHDKNYYYFCKSNIRIINLIVGSRNMIEVSKNMSLRKIRYRQFLSAFCCFWIGQNFGKSNG